MNLTLEQLIENNKGLIKQIANKYYQMTCIYGIEFEDLYQVGCLGLIEKYKEYDPSKGEMSTFVYLVVRTKILNYLNDSQCSITHIPKDLCLLSQRLAKANIHFYKKNGRYMTEEEQISLLQTIPHGNRYPDKQKLIKKLNLIIRYHYHNDVYALTDPILNYDTSGNFYDLVGETPTIEDLLVADCDVENEVIEKLNLETFFDSLDYLSYVEKETFIETLGLRDGILKTRRFLANREGISSQAIDQRYKKVLKKVREKTKRREI